MIYNITYGALSDISRKALIEDSPPIISINLQQAFLNLKHFGIDISDEKKKQLINILIKMMILLVKV